MTIVAVTSSSHIIIVIAIIRNTDRLWRDAAAGALPDGPGSLLRLLQVALLHSLCLLVIFPVSSTTDAVLPADNRLVSASRCGSQPFGGVAFGQAHGTPELWITSQAEFSIFSKTGFAPVHWSSPALLWSILGGRR